MLEQVLRQANDQLQQANRELARASRLKDAFLANMSHELRTPLQAILGGAELLREVETTLNERQDRTIQAIEASGRHLLSLINDLLDLSKIASGRVQLTLDMVSIHELCQASLQLVSEVAQQRGLTVTYTYDPVADQIVADERRLKQVLVNLLSNAIKFTPDGGTVGLVVRPELADGVLHFQVWDTGIGIAADDQQRIFAPFVQLDNSLARHYPGTGLGLSLVKHLTELHGGTVSVQSNPGEGSRFSVSLPWHRALVEPTVPADKPISKSIVAPLILFVGRPHQGWQALRERLAIEGYPVVVARTPDEGLTLAGALHPSVLVLDGQLAANGAGELLAQLRAEPAPHDVAMLVLVAAAQHANQPAIAVGDSELVLAWSEPADMIIAAIKMLQAGRKR
ncbi:MAG: ATP-binding protein [Oscillochloridaceae bacterium umkhey_bin13]